MEEKLLRTPSFQLDCDVILWGRNVVHVWPLVETRSYHRVKTPFQQLLRFSHKQKLFGRLCSVCSLTRLWQLCRGVDRDTHVSLCACVCEQSCKRGLTAELLFQGTVGNQADTYRQLTDFVVNLCYCKWWVLFFSLPQTAWKWCAIGVAQYGYLH